MTEEVKFGREFSPEAIDGETLDERREQRKEQLARFIAKMDRGEQKEFIGKVNQWTQPSGTRLVDAAKSVYDLNAPTKKLREDLTSTHAFAVPPQVVKRTPEERINALVARLQTAPVEQQEALLAQVASEYWKAGMPVTADGLRKVAAFFLNRTERGKGRRGVGV